MQKSEKSLADEQCSTASNRKEQTSFDQQLDSLNDQAERCRRLAGSTYDREVSTILGDMAAKYERSARALSRKRKT